MAKKKALAEMGFESIRQKMFQDWTMLKMAIDLCIHNPEFINDEKVRFKERLTEFDESQQEFMSRFWAPSDREQV